MASACASACGKRLRKRFPSAMVPASASRKAERGINNEGDRMNYRCALVGTAAAAVICVQCVCSAAEVAGAGNAGSDQLEEIVVTAEKRSETLLKAPLAVTAISQDALRDAGVIGLQDLTSNAPAVQMKTLSFTDAIQVSIRGISNTDFNEAGNPAVATYVDGIYVGRTEGLAG